MLRSLTQTKSKNVLEEFTLVIEKHAYFMPFLHPVVLLEYTDLALLQFH